jgi:hypothetical protein
MTDANEPAPDPGSNLVARLEAMQEAEAVREEVKRRVSAFLTRRGVVLRPQPLSMAELREQILGEWPDAIPETGTPEDLRFMGWYEEQLRRRMDEQAAITGNQLRMLSLVAWICTQQDIVRLSSITSTSIRRAAIRSLWLQGAWESPWSDLVEQELPGPPLTSEETDAFLASAPDDMARFANAQALVAELRSFMEERGYSLDPGDFVAVHSIGLEVLFIPSPDTDEGQRLVRQMRAWDRIRSSATQPDHAAWRQLIEHYLPE